MSQCLFVFPLQLPPEELLGQIKKLAEEYQGTLDGDEKSGRLAFQSLLGSIEGHYNIEGETLQLNITKKPFLVGCGTIQATIQEYLMTLKA